MKTTALISSLAFAAMAFAACKPADSSTPVEEAHEPLTPCNARFQATRAYVSFALEPDASAFPLAALAAEEVISSLRNTGCAPRSDLRDHATLVEALQKGALIVTAITFIAPMPHIAKVTVTEANYGDVTAPDARSFTIHLHRAKKFDQAAANNPDAQTVEAWRITGVALP